MVSSRWSGAARRCLTFSLVVVIGIQCWHFFASALRYDQVDFGVYRAGGAALLHGADLYGLRVGALHLPFTYPPAAAVLFAPFASLAVRPEQAFWTVCSLVALWYVIRLSLRRYATSRVGNSALIALGVFALVAHSNPLRVGMSQGQINVFIALLVLLDFSGVFPRLPRGCLIGIAAALKLTPAFLIIYLLVVRRFRAAGVAASTFFLVSLGAFAFGPSASWRYWVHGDFANARRTGDIQYISNQSINGVLVRLTGSPAHARPLWLVSVVATTICLLWLARRAHGARPWLGEALAMSGMLLVSPVSWVHHWIIVLPLLIASFRCAAEAASRTRVALVITTVALSAVLLYGVVWWVPIGDERVYHADPVQFLLGNSQVLLLLAVIASLAVFVVRGPRSEETAPASTHAPRINPVDARSPSRPGLNTR